MALNTCELWFNDIKINFFHQKLTKNRPAAGGDLQSLRRLGAPRPRPPSVIPLSYTTFLNTFPKLVICTFQLISINPFVLQNPGYVPAGNNDFRSSILRYLCPTKTSFLEIFRWRHFMWLWFRPPPNQKFWLRLWIGDRLKNFFENLFFLEHLRLCPWSLALASSIPVLDLERVCPRKGCPWPRALSSRLHLWFLHCKLLLETLFSMLNLFICFFLQFIARLYLNRSRLECIRQLHHFVYLTVLYRHQQPLSGLEKLQL